MNVDEFGTFLAAFELLHERLPSRHNAAPRYTVDMEQAQLVFRSVMTFENTDATQMEFDEFAAAVAALAAFRDPSPFRLWHAKIDAFVLELQRIAVYKELRFD